MKLLAVLFQGGVYLLALYVCIHVVVPVLGVVIAAVVAMVLRAFI